MTMIQHLNSLDEIVDKALTLDIASSHPVFFASGDESKFRVIKNNTSDHEVCTTSQKYSLLQHKDALNLVVSGIQAAGITGQGIMRNYNDTIVVETYFDNFEIRDQSQDGHVQLGMRFTNSFNKAVGFSGTLFGWRQVCQNGMLMNKLIPNAPIMSFKHMGDVKFRINNTIKAFVQDTLKIEGSVLKIINEAMQEIITFENVDQQLKFISEYVGSEYRAKQIFEIEPVELETTKWALYNCLTSYTSHTSDLSYNQYEKIHEGAQNLLTGRIQLPEQKQHVIAPLTI